MDYHTGYGDTKKKRGGSSEKKGGHKKKTAAITCINKGNFRR